MQQSKQNMASLTNEAAASSSSSSLPRSSADHQNHYTYEVFLSFRGEDTRFNFTDHLYTALCQRGIETFRDDKLSRGEDISQELLKAIEQSRVSIIVFSQNYAASRWCLDELVKILECRKSKGQEVRAVFYKVDPSDVRHQRGAFGDSFATLDQCKYKDSMDKWKAALKEAADLSGWPFKGSEYESKFINDIVGELSTQVINPSCELQVAANPIGIESCRQDVNRLLHTEENVVRMVGIWGPGGIGKTTIAKAVFNSICHEFKGSCSFLANVRSNALVELQETLLFDILKDSTLKVNNVDKGVGLIETRMQDKKVLLILDDVSHSSQLQNLVPSPDCFGPGSRILITTRDKRWLIAHQVDEVYEVKMLDDDQSLELFSSNAFKRHEPPGDYLELARRAVRYAQGLPLALIVLGSHLFLRSREEWEATLDSCRGEAPHREIRDVLKISFDALEVDLKGYFLDIACFFKGELVDDVKPILEACYDLKSVNGIAQLQEKALIRIDKGWRGCRIWMHDLIEEMGKDIVHQESPDEPGERSRVWDEGDVCDVLTNNTGTNKVIGIQVRWCMWLSSTILSLNAKSFSEMKNLRYISIRRPISFSGDIECLSNQLRWLDWEECPLQCFPSDFQANKLVELNITSYKIRRLWEGRKNFLRLTCMNLSGCKSLKELPDLSEIPNLKKLDLSACTSLKELPDLSGIPNLKELNLSHCTSLERLSDLSGIPNLKELNLSYCTSLERLPDLSGIPNLKELNLFYCTSLVEVPDSVGLLDKLVTLNVGGCRNLIMFPRKIYWKSLETISITCCKLEEFSEVGEEMDFLTKLELRGTRIEELHPSITKLIGLKVLDLRGSQSLTSLPYNIYELPNLKGLYAGGCSKLATFPKILVKMDSLRWLYLSGSDIRELDEAIENLIGLDELDLRNCKNLTTLPCSRLQNLRYLHLGECSKLVRFPTNTKISNVDGCSLSLPKLQSLDIGGCSLLSDCDFLMTLDCWETLQFLNLSRNNFVSLPACLTKFVNLRWLDLSGCKRLRGIPELPPSVVWLEIRGCELLEERFSKLTNRGAVIEEASPSTEDDDEEPSPTPVNPPKRQRTAAGGASIDGPLCI